MRRINNVNNNKNMISCDNNNINRLDNNRINKQNRRNKS